MPFRDIQQCSSEQILIKRNKQSQLIIVVSHDDEMVGAVEGVVDLGSMYQGK